MSNFANSVLLVWLVCGAANAIAVSAAGSLCGENVPVSTHVLAATMGPVFTLAVLMLPKLECLKKEEPPQ